VEARGSELVRAVPFKLGVMIALKTVLHLSVVDLALFNTKAAIQKLN
jgi:hypothetical protein